MAKCCATVNEALGLDTAALAEPLRTDAPLPSAPAMLSIDRPPGSRTFSTGAVRLSTAGTGGNNEDVPLAMVVHFDDSQILSAAYSVNTSARNSVNFYAHHARYIAYVFPISDIY